MSRTSINAQPYEIHRDISPYRHPMPIPDTPEPALPKTTTFRTVCLLTSLRQPARDRKICKPDRKEWKDKSGSVPYCSLVFRSVVVLASTRSRMISRPGGILRFLRCPKDNTTDKRRDYVCLMPPQCNSIFRRRCDGRCRNTGAARETP